jgi:cytochrome c-type biogenesis protein CcmH
MRFLPELVLSLALLLAAPAWAVEPGEMLDDPAQESRARELSAQLRCLVCQNESIDESHADLARDLRVLIREKIATGASNDDIRTFLVARYGNFILLQPPFKTSTLLLWLCTPLLLLAGGFAVYRASLRPRTTTAALTEAEERSLAELTAAASTATAFKDPFGSEAGRRHT